MRLKRSGSRQRACSASVRSLESQPPYRRDRPRGLRTSRQRRVGRCPFARAGTASGLPCRTFAVPLRLVIARPESGKVASRSHRLRQRLYGNTGGVVQLSPAPASKRVSHAGMALGDVASVADAGVANLLPVDCDGLEGSEQAAVIPVRDDQSCGYGELSEPPTKGGHSCLN